MTPFFSRVLRLAPCAVSLKLLVDAELDNDVYDERIVYKSEDGDTIGDKVNGTYEIRDYCGGAEHYDRGNFLIPAVVIIIEHRDKVLNIADGVAYERYAR